MSDGLVVISAPQNSAASVFILQLLQQYGQDVLLLDLRVLRVASAVLGLRHPVPFDVVGRSSFAHHLHHALSLLLIVLLLVLLVLLYELLLEQRVLKKSLEVFVQEQLLLLMTSHFLILPFLS